jgi:hypothetical protein
MSKCMYTAQGDFVCNENKDTKNTKDTIENFDSSFITASLPGGPYIDSCRNCEYTVSKSNPITQNNLKCDCLKNDSKTYKLKSFLPNCSKDIVNKNGNLQCGYNDK